MASPDLRIGVLLTHETQLLDISPIDLFGMLDDEYASLMPPGVNKLGKKIEITYIGPGPATGAAFAVQECTAKAGIRTTAVTSSPNVAVGAIDMLFIPGPNPTLPITKDTTDFVRQHAEAGTTILTVCTGCLIAAAAGILEGRSASGPRGLLPKLRKDHPGVKWDDKRRWVKDLPGEKKGGSKAVVWSSGGITNGQEMFAALIRELYPGPLSEMVCAWADVGDKGELYDTKVSVDTAWYIGQILRALFLGRRK